MAVNGGSIAFPYGVADADGARAYIAVRRSALLAVDLGDGAIRWRLERPLRPLLASREWVVALEPRSAASVALVVLAADGRPVCESASLAVPALADPWSEDFALAATRLADSIVVDWSFASRYRGGAAPGAEALAAASRSDAGRWRLDAATCAVETLRAPPVAIEARADEAELPVATPTAAGPDVLAQRALGDRLYQVARDPRPDGHVATVLRALAAQDGHMIWEVKLDEAAALHAAPLRQAPPDPRR